MTDAPTPRELFEHALKLLRTKQMDRFIDLFTEDAVLELPFAAPGAPRRLDGREALREYLDGYPDRLDIADFPVVLIHQTTDPETIVVEMTARGTTVRTGGAYELPYVAVVRIRGGRILSYRDYWSPVAVAIATAALPELVDALAEAGAAR